MKLCFRSSAQIRGSEQKHDGFSDSSSVDEAIDLKGVQSESNSKAHLLELDYKDLWALALTTAVGGHYLPWSQGLSAGFGSFMIATALIASAYVCLISSSAELSSALPFAGGCYGTARVTLGIFPGYLVGCADALKSILYTSAAATTIGHMFTFCTGGEQHWEPLYWLVFYVLSLSVHGYGGRPLWRCFAVFSITGFLLLVVYLLGSIPYTDLPEHAPMYESESDSEYDQWFHGGFYKFMHALPYPSWFFIGIQNINLACGEMRNPKTDVPRGYLAAITTVAFTSFAAILVAVSVHPGTSVLQHKTWPLTRGYEKMFHISERTAAFISLPATVSSGFGFMFFYGRQLRAMGQSGLLNPVFARELPDRHTPVGALLVGSLLGYGLCLLTHYNNDFFEPLYNLSKLCAYSVYISIFLSFLMFRARFPTITREYVSPLGNAGAALGIAIFALVFVSVCGFQHTYYTEGVFVALILIATAYYHAVVEKRQVFSEEEKTVMFKAYLLKGNAEAKNRIKKGNRAQWQQQRSGELGHQSGSSLGGPAPGSPVPRAETSTATTSTPSCAFIHVHQNSPPPGVEMSTMIVSNEPDLYSTASLITEEGLVVASEKAEEIL